MTFKEQYRKLLVEKKQNPAAWHDEAIDLIDKTIAPDKWVEAMAVCEAALDAGKPDESILNLRKEMFSHGKELHAGVNLNDEDYADWFVQLESFNKKLADAGVAEAWVELSSLYNNARYPLRDYEKSEEYMLRGVSLDDPLALTLHGYHLYHGINYADVDKEKGRELMLRAKEKNFERAETYLIMSEFHSDIAFDVYEQKIKDNIAAAKPADRLWGLLGDLYHDRLDDVEKALEAYNKGIETSNDPYCNYRKALLILNDAVEGDSDEALLMLKEAYEWNIVHAADFSGRFYCYSEKHRNVAKAIEWY
ncbi:MAG: hypothetical protein LBQ70_05180, partial [Prevotellaceae bacterium]|nr:hypothetical protein [Prevotellaceae bacterium]